jgi:hypothetical protein
MLNGRTMQRNINVDYGTPQSSNTNLSKFFVSRTQNQNVNFSQSTSVTVPCISTIVTGNQFSTLVECDTTMQITETLAVDTGTVRDSESHHRSTLNYLTTPMVPLVGLN